MNEKTNYKILKAHKLIIETYKGSIDAKDIIANKAKSSTAKDYNPHYAILLDFRNAHINLKPKEIKKMFAWLKAHPLFQAKKKVAYLTSEPNEVVLTTLFKLELKDMPIDAAIFHTVQPALYWLQIDGIDENHLIELLSELET